MGGTPYQKEGDGYICKNAGCGEVLTLKNRDEHNRTHCLHNPWSKKSIAIVKKSNPPNNVSYASSYYKDKYESVDCSFDLDVPTLNPEMDDMRKMNPIVYVTDIIENLHHYHETTGLVKIRPPTEFQEMATIPNCGNFSSIKLTPPYLQRFDEVTKGFYRINAQHKYRTFQVAPSGKEKSLTGKEYVDLCRSWHTPPPTGYPKTDVFWDRSRLLKEAVLYATDVDQSGSMFNPKYNIWNLDKLTSLLGFAEKQFPKQGKIPGITQVYIYFGAWGTAFNMHRENMDTYSINYLHFAETDCAKEWYTIHPADKEKMLTYLQEVYEDDFHECKTAERHKLLFPSPYFLSKRNIRVGKTLQNKGEFIIALPGEYHWGYNRGENVAEAVNFGTERWLYDIAPHVQLCPSKCEYFAQDFRFDVDLLRKEYEKWKSTQNRTSGTSTEGNATDTASGSQGKKNKRPLRNVPSPDFFDDDTYQDDETDTNFDPNPKKSQRNKRKK